MLGLGGTRSEDSLRGGLLALKCACRGLQQTSLQLLFCGPW
jgi:hypothetical protein